MKQTILIMGGYGGVGKSLSRALLSHTAFDLIIAGRQLKKAEAWVAQLQSAFPGRRIVASQTDLADKANLVEVFRQASLVVVVATVADDMEIVAEAAIAAQTGLMDILLRADVAETLSRYQQKIAENGLRFITQAGFHPGIVAPLMRSVRGEFDEYHSAVVGMAMDPIFRNPKSTHELFHEILAAKPMILRSGKWKTGSYRDLAIVNFSKYFSPRKCFPLNLPEIYGIEKTTGLKNAGVYVAGFDFWIDWVIFPLAITVGFFSQKWSKVIGGKMLFAHIQKKRDQRPRVEMVLEASGLKDEKEKKLTRTLYAEDGFDLTAYAVVACIRQYFKGIPPKPGLYLMGQVVEENQLLEDLQEMGIGLEERQ
ncbi:MAG: SDR family NAD(P)-dependent oxidoreductase [Bacteroidia bacterium]|nr:SDR family NAD(P)-dependent oxidoreductase [Bacteroidia bacterium]